MSTVISVKDINTLRTQTGAGLTDCKKALEEAAGDFEKAIEYLRKKGQKIAAARGDREATEGVVVAALAKNNTIGYLLCLSCETDFVSKNQDFMDFAQKVLAICTAKDLTTLAEIGSQALDGATVQQKVDEMVGKIGEKISFTKYQRIEDKAVVSYIHGANRIGVLVGLNNNTTEAVEAGKNVAMQIAAMNPLALDEKSIDPLILQKEEAFIKEQISTDPNMSSKPAEMIDKIAKGKLQAFLKENTLLSQSYVKDNAKTVGSYLASVDSALAISAFKRVAIG